jgi:hypothetical protein
MVTALIIPFLSSDAQHQIKYSTTLAAACIAWNSSTTLLSSSNSRSIRALAPASQNQDQSVRG